MANYRFLPEAERKGKTTYNDGIVKGIVVLAVSEVKGVSLKKEGKKDKLDLIKVSFNGDVVSVDVSVDVTYGNNVPDVAFDIQESVKHNVEAMSRYKVDSVDVHIDGVLFTDVEEK
ncbi:MAG: Asp23/Gls24 family envelope stress response protein [Clostridia bacterium]|nr:Asp23/Gls24 family envelope stress response protein [Clostridia bacterium]